MNAARIPAIIVRNAQRKHRVDLATLQRFATAALAHCLRAFPARRDLLAGIPEVVALIISDRRMSSLHKRFLNVAGPTDVITFQHGEILVSIDTAERNAVGYRTSTDQELRLYVVHGILHLLGFDDTAPAAARAMAKAQEKIMAALQKVRSEPG